MKVKFRARRKGGLKGIKVLWDFNNDGIIDAKGKRASFIFVKNGRIKVRAVLVKGALRSAVAKMTIRVYK